MAEGILTATVPAGVARNAASVGNNASTSTDNQVKFDATPPVITLNGSAAVTLECGVDTYTEQGATAVDACDPNVSVTVGGDTVDATTPGVYVVTYDAVDAAGNSAVVTRTVEVVDTTAPVITLNGPADLTLECSIDTYTEQGASAADACDPNVSVTIGGDTVDATTPGTYVVSYDAVDAAGNAAPQVTRTVEVVDATDPVINCPANIEVDAASPVGTYVSFSATATDACDPEPSVTCTPTSNSLFPIGVTVVTCTAEDDSGNTASCSFTVKVRSPEEMLENAIERVENLPIHHGVKNALLAKLMNALSNLLKGNTTPTLNKLEAFKNHVEAQRGKKLTDAQADECIAMADAIVAAIAGGPPPPPPENLEAITFGDRLVIVEPVQIIGLELERFETDGGEEGVSYIFRIRWDKSGVLETSLQPGGPWTEVPLATSPYWHEVLIDEPRRFFRLRMDE